MMLANATLAVGVILFEGVNLLDFSGPAGYLEMLPFLAGTPVEFYSISTEVGQLQGTDYTPLYATNTYQDAPEHLDILIVPGATDKMVEDEKLVSFIRDLAEEATDVLTICTGGRLTAATGLLDGKRATTNKEQFDDISSANPNVNWVRQARWAEDGKWWTSSGVSASLDMANAYVTNRYGAAVADRISLVIEYIPNKDPSDDPFA